MASFTKTGTPIAFGVNKFLRSTVGLKYASYTVAANAVPLLTIGDGSKQRILQPGTAMAKITSGPDTGKIGPYQAAGTADKWTMTPGGTWSAGTFKVSCNGLTTAAIAFGAANTVVQAACDLAFGAGNVVVTGGPQATTPTVYTCGGNFTGPQTVSLDISLITGTAPTNTPVHTVTGVVGALDGRSTTSNIVGICGTFVGWQFIEHDVEVGVLYDGTVVQGWCLELDVNSASIALQNATATAMVAQKTMSVTFA